MVQGGVHYPVNWNDIMATLAFAVGHCLACDYHGASYDCTVSTLHSSVALAWRRNLATRRAAFVIHRWPCFATTMLVRKTTLLGCGRQGQVARRLSIGSNVAINGRWPVHL
jgi:hypothetical protein